VGRSRLVIPLVVALLWVAVPVEARSDGACPDGVGCVWDKTDFQGKRAQVPPTGCIDSNIRSAVNATDQVLEFFVGAGCYGLRAGTLQPGDETSQIKAGSATGDCSHGPVDPCSDEPPSAPSP
jgi:hypothetical protein